ncbi:MAG: treS, partial [Segetibacter sp.]|nr:treS [Segetibacter sp.]
LVPQLENGLLQKYLMKVNWFLGKGRTVYQVNVTSHATIPLKSYNAVALLVEVVYESGLPETYHLPVTFVPEHLSKNVVESCPQALIATLKVGNEQGLICDALFTTELPDSLIKNMASHSTLKLKEGQITYKGNTDLQSYVQEYAEIRSKIHKQEKSFTSVNYDNSYYLKIYRKVDKSTNPDVEITRFLSNEVKFANIPPYVGTIEWNTGQDTIVLGMMQVMIENHGDGKTFMLDRLNNYVERLLARDRYAINALPLVGSLSNPVGIDELPEELKAILGTTATEQVRLFGIKTGEMHLALASGNEKDFVPEDFSLHYQRSLFSSMQSLVREAYQSKIKNIDKLDEDVKEEVREILGRKEEVLTTLKRIYAKKLDVIKIRIHGNFHLGNILFTGKDIAINNFIGDPNRTFSERRLKRSPLRDVAGMVRALHYVAYEGFFLNTHLPKEDVKGLMPFAELWSHYMSQFFIHAYLETVQFSSFIPKEKDDLKMMLETYLLEKAIHDLNYELNHRPEWAVVPLRVIKSILK